MPYLERTILSVKNQNYPGVVEHIVMDGASNDGSVETLQRYPGLMWKSEKDRGQSHALNKGFAQVSGEIIGWLNSDDTYTPGTFETVNRYFQENPDVYLIGTDLNIIDENDVKIGYTKSASFNTVELLTINMVKQPTVFMRKEVLDKVGYLNESLHYVMDWEFWLRVGNAGYRFDYLLNEVFANFRLIKGTKTFDLGPDFIKEWFKVLKKEINMPIFNTISQQEKNRILKRCESDVLFNEMKEAASKRNRVKLLKIFLNVSFLSPVTLMNRGLYKLLYFGLLGIQINRTHKFTKFE